MKEAKRPAKAPDVNFKTNGYFPLKIGVNSSLIGSYRPSLVPEKTKDRMEEASAPFHNPNLHPSSFAMT